MLCHGEATGVDWPSIVLLMHVQQRALKDLYAFAWHRVASVHCSVLGRPHLLTCFHPIGCKFVNVSKPVEALTLDLFGWCTLLLGVNIAHLVKVTGSCKT
jgi:hypothetical protein